MNVEGIRLNRCLF